MQSLCTLHDHCRQGSCNTRYQAGAAPYLGRSSTGWIAPACLAHSVNHLVGASDERRRQLKAERFGGLEVEGGVKVRGRPHRNVARIAAPGNLVNESRKVAKKGLSGFTSKATWVMPGMTSLSSSSRFAMSSGRK